MENIISNIDFKIKKEYTIFKIKFNILCNETMDVDFLIQYENKKEKILATRNIYCVKNSKLLNKYIKKINIKNAKHVNSYIKSSYYNIDNIYLRDNKSHVIIRNNENIFFIYSNELKNKENTLWCVIREVIHRKTEDMGGIMLHSGALAFDNNDGIFILGKKGAGKTTLITSLLNCNDYDFCSNERMLIRKDDKKAISIHYPIRLGTRNIINNETLYEYILNNYNKLIKKQSMTLEKLKNFRKDKKLEEDNANKIELEISEFLQCFNAEYKPIVNPKMFLIPEISENIDGYLIEEIGKEEAEEIIKSQCYTPYDKTWPEPWVEKRAKANEELKKMAEDFIRNLIEDMRVIRLKYGYNFYRMLKNKKKNFFKEVLEKNI